MTTTECGNCSRPSPHAFLCARCVTTFDRAIGNIAAYYADLDQVVRVKQTRYASSVRTRASVGKTQPLPIDGRFADPAAEGSDLLWSVRNDLTVWCRMVLDHWPPVIGPACRDCDHASCRAARARRHPENTISSMCGYLGAMRRAIAVEVWAAVMLDEVLFLERRLRRFIDRPKDRWYAGQCGFVLEAERAHDQDSCACGCHLTGQGCDIDGGCGSDLPTVGGTVCRRDLYGSDEPWIRCGDCGSTYSRDDRRRQILIEASDREATTEAIARIVSTVSDHDIDPKRLAQRIRTWSRRGLLQAHGSRVVDGQSRPTYRIGDVLTLLAADRRVSVSGSG